MTLAIHPLTSPRWPELVELFERRGPRGGAQNSPAYGCWCMYWRDRSLPHGEPKKQALAELVRAGRETGLLAYDDGRPVGWVSIAPREEYGDLLRSPQYRPRTEEHGVWSIVCFTIDRGARGRGLAPTLLDAAVAHACSRRASTVEAYPHATKADDYMGSLELFLGRGFAETRQTTKRRVVRREC